MRTRVKPYVNVQKYTKVRTRGWWLGTRYAFWTNVLHPKVMAETAK